MIERLFFFKVCECKLITFHKWHEEDWTLVDVKIIKIFNQSFSGPMMTPINPTYLMPTVWIEAIGLVSLITPKPKAYYVSWYPYFMIRFYDPEAQLFMKIILFLNKKDPKSYFRHLVDDLVTCFPPWGENIEGQKFVCFEAALNRLRQDADILENWGINPWRKQLQRKKERVLRGSYLSSWPTFERSFLSDLSKAYASKHSLSHQS